MRSTLPDLKLLRIFTSVVRHQGFAPAQQDLGLSASAISTYMSQLERQLGIVLCHRGRSGFSLTSKGELYHQECVRILGELEGFERYATALQGELRGTMTVGVLIRLSRIRRSRSPTSSVNSAEHTPGVYLDLKIQTPHELQVGVLDDRIDVAIGAFASPMNGLTAQALHASSTGSTAATNIRSSRASGCTRTSSPVNEWSPGVIGAKPSWLAKDSPRDRPPSRTWRPNSF